MQENATLKNFLDLHSISEKKYIVGTFQEGITVYKQQVRTLNLLYCLIELKKIKTSDNIAVIGGGIAGLTMASALLEAGYHLCLYEKNRIFLNVQYGCDTRRIHPHLYDWPMAQSLFKFADLPILSWKADTAANVSKQIYNGYERVKAKHQDRIKEYKNCSLSTIRRTKDSKYEIDWDTVEDEERCSSKFDIIIYTPGYGIEKNNIDKKDTASYWRNDDFAQLRMTSEIKNYLISGVGDGGLIDLLRLKIFGFNEEIILSEFQANCQNYGTLINSLSKIKNQYNNIGNENLSTDWLYTQFEHLDNKKCFVSLKDILKSRERVENNVVLIGKCSDIKEVLDYSRISLLNAMFTYCIYKLKMFSYLKDDDEKVKLFWRKSAYKKIIRHGPDRENILKGILLTDLEINSLKTKQKHNLSVINKTARLWPSGWWSSLFETGDYKPSIEFFTSDTQSICTGFVAVLSKVIEHFYEKIGRTKDFRIALHRIVKVQDKIYFQQITNYFGTRQVGEIGRVFPITGGAVGYCARIGKPILCEKIDKKAFNELLQLLDLNTINARSLDKEVESLLALPILGATKSGQVATNLVLYLDSSEYDFFQKPDIFPLIVKAIEGFIESVNSLLVDNQIIMSEIDFKPMPINISSEDLEILKNSCIREIGAGDSTLYRRKSYVLKFKSYYSFNTLFQNENDPFQ